MQRIINILKWYWVISAAIHLICLIILSVMGIIHGFDTTVPQWCEVMMQVSQINVWIAIVLFFISKAIQGTWDW